MVSKMKRLVPLAVVMAAVASVAINCSERGGHLHDLDPIGSDDGMVCGAAMKTVTHQLKYIRGSDNRLASDIDGSCPWPCPGNSPLVNSFPIDGLDIDGSGACTPEGVRVDPGTAGNSACGSGYLQFVEFLHKGSDSDEIDARLQIRNRAGATCAGSDLVGATFSVSSKKQTVTLKITDVADIPYGVAIAGKPKQTHEGYRIVATLDGETTGSASALTSVCDAARSVAVRAALGLPDMSGDYSVHWGSGAGTGSGSAEQYADYAIPVPGPLYSVYVRPLRKTTSFFNLACATDALAKVTLDKIATKDDGDDKRYAALRMLTATYCYKPRTARNRRFHYEYGGSQGSGSAQRETWWDAVLGARCLEHPRLEELGLFKDVNLGSDLIPAACGSDYGHEKCADWKAWANEVRNECVGSGADNPGIPAEWCDEKESGMDYKSYIPVGSGSSANGANTTGPSQGADRVVRWIRP